MKVQTSADAEDAPYLSKEYLQYYIEKNDIKVNIFNKPKKVEDYINNCDGEFVSVERVTGFFQEPYYAMTRGSTEFVYMGQMKDNKPDGIGALFKLVNLSMGENDNGELVADVEEYSDWSYEEDTYFARIYIGNFKEGRPEGYGIEFSSPGDDDYFINNIYLDDYENGDYQTAIYDMANPQRYEGEFKEGNYSGQGNAYIYMDSYSYEADIGDENVEEIDLGEYSELFGEEKGRKMQEIVSGRNKDITISSGYYEDGELNGEVRVYELGYLSYEGEMKKGEKHGKGIEYFSCSEQVQYEGEWAYGRYNGTGILYNEDGTVDYSGEWEGGDYAH